MTKLLPPLFTYMEQEDNLSKYNKLTYEELEKFLLDLTLNPKEYKFPPIGRCSNGLYHIGLGCYTGRQGFIDFINNLMDGGGKIDEGPSA